MKKAIVLLALLLAAPKLMAQQPDPPVNSRADEIEAQRLEKSRNLWPDVPPAEERRFKKTTRLLWHSPLRFEVAGRGPGAGFGVGTEFAWHSDTDAAIARIYGNVTVRRFYIVGTGLEFPHLVDGVSLSLNAFHRDAPQLEYYGPGPDSLKSNRTDFREEDTVFSARATATSIRHFTPSCGVAGMLVNVGPGTNSSLATTQSKFGPAEAPGIDQQSNYLIWGCSAQADFLDLPGDPHKGTFLAATFDRYDAVDDDIFSFHRLSAVADQYIPFWNRKRVIALRAKTDLSFHSDNQVVPFYLQPTLGSDTDLRGFRRFRFYDQNALSFTAEYRWEICTGFDMALFGDAGKVFNRPGQISLSNLETSAGFGFRFKSRSRMAARLDTGFSNEGFQVWLKFGKLF